MSDFLQAYERMIVNEGGYVLHTVQNDRGGQTYAGIARNAWPKCFPKRLGWPIPTVARQLVGRSETSSRR